ncbi:uncharacterized protein KY384_000004 [Bacidia gigantensis]|uniref:uncharacterized protein n=1 Tax=Bacidia gigantensis TaxID=2732470 RepID=UPI001D0383C2|nr:uncharacterized protein KY384_000004 [Bacidia gigantensis]KAG8526411.1 hypothetical protein KY384_000004 [Bacidia gigantensis]
MPSQKILICGAGVAGSIVAYWLAKHDFQVVVIERSKAAQKAGQGIEIEEPALQVVKLMAILDELNERRTKEQGFQLVDAQGRSHGILDVGGVSPTGALEIMRGDLTQTLSSAAEKFPNVTYRYETTISSLTQTPDRTTVHLTNRATNPPTTTEESFSLVIGADGVNSTTRTLAMGSPQHLRCFHPVSAYVAYFSIPSAAHDWPRSQLCHFPRRRIIWKRPVGPTSPTTSIYIIHPTTAPNASLSAANASGDREKQKRAFADLFDGGGGHGVGGGGMGWETSRIVKEMLASTNFYSDELVQVKLQRWSSGRVVLVGDAAWAPTPFTGEGNQLAILGAWVLAQEIVRNSHDPDPVDAFGRYEARLRGMGAVYFCAQYEVGDLVV